MTRILLLLPLLAICAAQEPPAGGKGKGKGRGNLSAVAKLRDTLLQTYCPTHDVAYVCQVCLPPNCSHRRHHQPRRRHCRRRHHHHPLRDAGPTPPPHLRHHFRCPAQNRDFMKKLKAATTAEDKKKILMERQVKLKSVPADQKKEMQAQAMAALHEIYTGYCAPGANTPNKIEEVCTNEMIKNLYATAAPKADSHH